MIESLVRNIQNIKPMAKFGIKHENIVNSLSCIDKSKQHDSSLVFTTIENFKLFSNQSYEINYKKECYCYLVLTTSMDEVLTLLQLVRVFPNINLING